MSPSSDPSDKNRNQYAFNITLAAVAGQVGCLTLVIVLVALFAGLWLDARFGTKPMLTIGLTIASIPITLVAMFWVVRTATSRLQSTANKNNPKQKEEETNSGKYS